MKVEYINAMVDKIETAQMKLEELRKSFVTFHSFLGLTVYDEKELLEAGESTIEYVKLKEELDNAVNTFIECLRSYGFSEKVINSIILGTGWCPAIHVKRAADLPQRPFVF